ncbi:MAG: hypothetical protein GF344_02020, partial [Chitinivibrionales bacterium]|nr:hypothetical protein [Chitinivibrionales bacterium]MBD3355873.1 hypothetical protein [Chitinivibrionales bacterium]
MTEHYKMLDTWESNGSSVALNLCYGGFDIQSYMDVLEHLLITKGYTCLKYVIIGNEPQWNGVTPQKWFNFQKEFLDSLHNRGYDEHIKFVTIGDAKGHSNHYKPIAENQYYNAMVSAWDMHYYAQNGNSSPTNKLWDILDGKVTRKYFMTEAGSQEWLESPGVNTVRDKHVYAATVAKIAWQSLAYGYSGVIFWSFDDAIFRHDGEDSNLWGFWDAEDLYAGGRKLRPWFY